MVDTCYLYDFELQRIKYHIPLFTSSLNIYSYGKANCLIAPSAYIVVQSIVKQEVCSYQTNKSPDCKLFQIQDKCFRHHLNNRATLTLLICWILTDNIFLFSDIQETRNG
jgi:hypothetical protein